MLPSNNPAAAVPALSMEFASMCLSNALLLLPPDPLDATEVTTTEDGDTRYVRHASPLCFFVFNVYTCHCQSPWTPVLRRPCVVDRTLKSNYYYWYCPEVTLCG